MQAVRSRKCMRTPSTSLTQCVAASRSRRQFSNTHFLLASRRRLPDAPARTRFAPSPTGYLHLGSLRTALFNYLLAKKTGGQFLLRLEDTDRKRTVEGAEERLYEDLIWAGLQWDEGPGIGGPYGPYRQSDRTSVYRDHAHKLLETRHAYRCFCSAERLNQLAQQRKELGLPTDYDRLCESLSTAESEERAHRGDPFVVRLRAPESYPTFSDMIYGVVGRSSAGFNAGVTHKHGEIVFEDPVLLKSDGHPTYHLANVVDDHLMKITHVVRATEWLSSTPKHLALYDAFGWAPPEFAHVGLLTDEEGQKLSKRKMDTTLGSFRRDGVLRDALVNFAALLGWSHGKKSDVMDLQELVDEFQMRFTKGNTTVTFEKLAFLQRSHAARAASRSHETATVTFKEMLDATSDYVDAAVQSGQDVLPDLTEDADAISTRVGQLLRHDARNYESPAQFFERNRYFFAAPPASAQDGLPEFVNPAPDAVDEAGLARMAGSVLDAPDWTADSLDQCSRRICLSEGSDAGLDAKVQLRTPEDKGRYRALCKYIRWALLAGSDGPGVVATLAILGRDECLRRFGALDTHRA